MQLGYDNPFGTVDDKCPLVGHIRDCAEVNVLYHGIKVLMFRIGAVEFQLGLKRDAEGQASFNTFLDGITRGINLVIDKFEHEIIPGIGNRKVLLKNSEKSLIFPVFRCCL